MATETAVDPAMIRHMLKVALQGGGQVKWKPSEKKRPNHSSSIQLPAVYETWKEPSRVNRRRTQAAAAAAAEARRSSRSVPTISRRDRTETPESNSSVDSPPSLQKPKHSKPKDAGKKTTSPTPTKKTTTPLSPKEPKAREGATQAKGDRSKIHAEENNNVVTKTSKELTQSNKFPSEGLPRIEKEDNDNVGTVHKDGPSVRLKDSNTTTLTEQKKGEKHEKTISKSTSKESNEEYQRTNAAKGENITDQSAKVLNKLPKRTAERTTSEKKHENISHKPISEARKDKTASKSYEDNKTRTLDSETRANLNRTHAQAHTKSTLWKQRLNESPTKAPPSRPTNSRIGTGFSSRVNPRSKSDLGRSKPPMQRRRTKTGFFTSSGEFVTNDEDGKQSEVSAETSRTKRTEATTTTRRSNVSGSTSSTKSSWKSTTSSETSKKPLRQRPTIITKKTLARQKFYNSVYNNQHYKIQRQTTFLKKVENAQLKIDKEKTRESANAQEKKHESVVRQYQTLKHIRDKFDEEQVKRFSRQYVSWRSVEEDRLNRQSSMYGLPDNIYEDRYDKTLKEIPKIKKPKSKTNPKSDKKFSRYVRWVKNIRRFERILKPNIGAGLEDSMLRSTHGALVEGRDIVELHQSGDDAAAKGGEGPKKTKKIVKVRNVIGSAKRLLQATQDMDAISEVSNEDAFDDDDGYSDVSSLDLSDDE